MRDTMTVYDRHVVFAYAQDVSIGTSNYSSKVELFLMTHDHQELNNSYENTSYAINKII